MTADELRELDAEISRLLFGWQWFRHITHGRCTIQPPEGGEWRRSPWGPGLFEPVGGVPLAAERYSDWDASGTRQVAGRWYNGMPRFSTDIAAAWRVVEWLKQQEYGPVIDCGGSPDGWRVQCEFQVYVTEATAPLAVCRAALKALESM